MKQKIKKVTKKTNIAKLVYEYPETVEVFMNYGLHCVGCPVSEADSLETGARIHGLSDEEIVQLVKRVNEVIKFKK